jgi:hypothetical protein
VLEPGIVRIDTDIPFGELIYWRHHLACKASLETLIRLSHYYSEHYLAWEEVRKGINPFFVKGTGFEGYFVGICNSPEDVLEQLLRLGHEMLDNLTRLHPFEKRFQAKLLKALHGQATDPKAIAEWSAEFGAALARLRCNVIRNQQADAFHSHTYQIVRSLPPIQYETNDHTIRQHYAILACEGQSSRIVLDPRALRSLDQEAWLVVETIGRFGHPLVREFVRGEYLPGHIPSGE